ncbi:MAG: hypothetical protein NWR12_06650 [Haliea sp.]|nr:hypothetical protein [Haliea sp.]
MADGDTIREEDLQFSSRTAATDPTQADETSAEAIDIGAAFGNLEGYLEDIERNILQAALEQSRWNKTATAKLLGISFRSLRYRLQKLHIED